MIELFLWAWLTIGALGWVEIILSEPGHIEPWELVMVIPCMLVGPFVLLAWKDAQK